MRQKVYMQSLLSEQHTQKRSRVLTRGGACLEEEEAARVEDGGCLAREDAVRLG